MYYFSIQSHVLFVVVEVVVVVVVAKVNAHRHT